MRWWCLLVFLLSWVPTRARAEGPQAPPPVELASAKDVKDKLTPDLDKKAEENAEAEKEAERRRKERLARVIVLKWNGKSADYTNETLQRNVRSRIARPDAQFFPDVDLYQNGRKVKDRTVVPAMQRGIVPEENLEMVREAVAEVAGIPEAALRPDAWGERALEMRQLIEKIWFVDRVEAREPLFLLYAQIGRAAKYQNSDAPPFFDQIGETAVNYYYYLAATLAFQDSTLMSKLTDSEVRRDIDSILRKLKEGRFPTLKIDFQLDDETDFDLEAFSKVYEIYLNGILLEDLDEQGQYSIFLGRTDIYLKRKDSGHGLSERLEVTKLEDKVYFVRQTARKKMGLDFIDQLFEHPNECVPTLDGEILNYLAIYARIHEKAEVYIAVPYAGNPNKVYIWRYNRETATLTLVEGGIDDFPVRFAILGATGVMYNGAAPSIDTSVDAGDIGTVLDPSLGAAADRLDPNLKSAYVPLDLQLRGHYNRLMVNIGMEAGFSMGSKDDHTAWFEKFHLPGLPEGSVYDGVPTHFQAVTPSGSVGEGPGGLVTEGREYTGVPTDPREYNEKLINRDVYLGASVVFGRDAGVGFGPRLGGRLGWTNLPYALQTTLHLGWTTQIPGLAKDTGRVRPLVDLDARGGLSWPFPTSLAHQRDQKVTINPIFGLTAGVGTTF